MILERFICKLSIMIIYTMVLAQILILLPPQLKHFLMQSIKSGMLKLPPLKGNKKLESNINSNDFGTKNII